MTLRAKIEAEIRERGPIPFSHYMELCLCDPELGYYSRPTEKFGRAGDFYTSSDVHAVFGRLLARQLEEMWRVLDSPQQIEVLELGPERGLFAHEVLDWSEKKFSDFFRSVRYTLVERSPALRQTLKARLSQHLSSGRASIADTEAFLGNARALPTEVPTIVVANEFFDALPVEVLSAEGSLRIGVEGGRFVEKWVPASADELDFLDHYGVHPERGERTEICFQALTQVEALAEVVHRGFLILIDYGYTREEQLAGRHLGTVMTYRQHTASSNPYQAPGEQDITAHVNFTALATVRISPSTAETSFPIDPHVAHTRIQLIPDFCISSRSFFQLSSDAPAPP